MGRNTEDAAAAARVLGKVLGGRTSEAPLFISSESVFSSGHDRPLKGGTGLTRAQSYSCVRGTVAVETDKLDKREPGGEVVNANKDSSSSRPSGPSSRKEPGCHYARV